MRRPHVRKSAVASLAAAGAAAVTLTLAPSPAHAAEPAKASTAQTQAQTDKIEAIVKAGEKKHGDDLDGWIRTALDVMDVKNIPGTYDGLHRNIMRESSGNPKAQNNWDVNARNGIPSKGLLQTIQPTFDAYHVKGTPRLRRTRCVPGKVPEVPPRPLRPRVHTGRKGDDGVFSEPSQISREIPASSVACGDASDSVPDLEK
nr:hypothetical protein [Streptomyces violaceorubidus]